MPKPAQMRSDGGKNSAEMLGAKVDAGTFDVFLCHNSHDKPQVKQIGLQLKDRGILPWLDEWELRPGLPWQDALEEQIENVASAAIFVGGEGVGPWQHQELAALLRKFVQLRSPVIPVLLPDASTEPDLPLFLEGLTYVDFRVDDPDPMERLVWGITGHHGTAAAKSKLIQALQEPENSNPAPAFRPAFQPPAPSLLEQTIIGSWQVQIANPFGIVAQMAVQFTPDHFFRGQLPTPMGLAMMEGQWQVMPGNQLSAQGRQSIGFQVMPYFAMIQFSQVGPYQLVGATSAGEQTMWQKVG